MELDEMRVAWQELDQRLQCSEALQSDLRRELSLDRTRSTLRGWLWLPGFELAISAGVAWLAGSFLGDNRAQVLAAPAGALPALVLLGLAVFGAVASVRQIVAVASIDYAAPVLAIQRRLALARRLRIRLTQLGLLLWLPLWPVFVVFVVQRGLGMDIYRQFGLGWLVANVGFGLLLAWLLVWLAGRYGERLSQWRPLRRLADSIAGRRLTAATAQLEELSRFDRE